jgi:hypothetical protein
MKAPVAMKPEDRDEARRLVVLALLRNLLAAARKKVDVVVWRALGGPEAEDFMHALETGGAHPLLEKWRELRRTIAANRPAASLLDQNTRHNVILLVEALQRAGLGKDAARRRAAEALQRVLPTTTKRTIKYWQGNYSITVDGEQLIARAIEQHGHDHDRLVGWFLGLIDWADTPVAAWTAVRRIPPDGQ